MQYDEEVFVACWALFWHTWDALTGNAVSRGFPDEVTQASSVITRLRYNRARRIQHSSQAREASGGAAADAGQMQGPQPVPAQYLQQ